MRFIDYFLVSISNLWRQKARTILTILAVEIGAVSVLLMLSLVIGAKTTMTNQLEKIGGFTMVTVTKSADSSDQSLFTSDNSDDGKKITDETLLELKKINNVKSLTPVVSPWVDGMRLEGYDKKTHSYLLGYDPDAKAFNIDLLAGKEVKSTDTNKIVVSFDTLKRLGFKGEPAEALGKNIILNYKMGVSDWMPDPSKPPANTDKSWWESQNKAGSEISTEIVGVSAPGMSGEQNLISLNWAKQLMIVKRWESDEEAMQKVKEECEKQSMLAKESGQKWDGKNCGNQTTYKLVRENQLDRTGYGSVIMQADNPKNVGEIAKSVVALGFGATTAEEMLKEINKIFTTLGIIFGAIGGISLAVAAIGIINTMAMAILERTREIGVLRACGATKVAIRRLFTIEASMLGFFGGLFGYIISLILALLANIAVNKFASSSNIPIQDFLKFPLWLVGGMIGFTTIVGLLAGWIPAIRASKLDPVEALRYE